MSKDNSGPAFPNRGNETYWTEPGMTLRDYFAGQALAGICANCDSNGENGWTGAEDLAARKAYVFADAMLRARQQ